jgi:hypothetical protein
MLVFCLSITISRQPTYAISSRAAGLHAPAPLLQLRTFTSSTVSQQLLNAVACIHQKFSIQTTANGCCVARTCPYCCWLLLLCELPIAVVNQHQNVGVLRLDDLQQQQQQQQAVRLATAAVINHHQHNQILDLDDLQQQQLILAASGNAILLTSRSSGIAYPSMHVTHLDSPANLLYSKCWPQRIATRALNVSHLGNARLDGCCKRFPVNTTVTSKRQLPVQEQQHHQQQQQEVKLSSAEISMPACYQSH